MKKYYFVVVLLIFTWLLSSCDLDNSEMLPDWIIGTWEGKYYGTPYNDTTKRIHQIVFNKNGKMEFKIFLDDVIINNKIINVEVGKGMHYDGINSDLNIYELNNGKKAIGWFSHYNILGKYQLVIYLDEFENMTQPADLYPFVKK